MAQLYTINGLYPDRNFAFTLTAAQLGMAPAEHGHAIADVLELPNALADKSAAGHTHVALPSLNIGSEKLTHTITLTGAAIAQTNGVISIGAAPAQTGIVGGFRNANPARRHSMLYFFIGSKQTAGDSAEYFIFTEDSDAASS